MALVRCPVSIVCSRGTPPKVLHVGSKADLVVLDGEGGEGGVDEEGLRQRRHASWPHLEKAIQTPMARGRST